MEKDIDDILEEQEISKEEGVLGLPITFHSDGTPIFERTDIIRPAVPIHGKNKPIMYQDLALPEHRALRPESRFNLIVLPKSSKIITRCWLGRGSTDKRSGVPFGRLYQAVDGGVIAVLQRTKPDSYETVDQFVVQGCGRLQFVVAPPGWDIEFINPQQVVRRVVEIQAREEKRQVDHLDDLDGMGYIIENEGKVSPNSNYHELPTPRFMPAHKNYRFLQPRPLYVMYSQFPTGFDFIDPVDKTFFHGAV